MSQIFSIECRNSIFNNLSDWFSLRFLFSFVANDVFRVSLCLCALLTLVKFIVCFHFRFLIFCYSTFYSNLSAYKLRNSNLCRRCTQKDASLHTFDAMATSIPSRYCLLPNNFPLHRTLYRRTMAQISHHHLLTTQLFR